jgi:hypothetical protein
MIYHEKERERNRERYRRVAKSTRMLGCQKMELLLRPLISRICYKRLRAPSITLTIFYCSVTFFPPLRITKPIKILFSKHKKSLKYIVIKIIFIY